MKLKEKNETLDSEKMQHFFRCKSREPYSFIPIMDGPPIGKYRPNYDCVDRPLGPAKFEEEGASVEIRKQSIQIPLCLQLQNKGKPCSRETRKQAFYKTHSKFLTK